ncbi:MAG: hypothetical protein ACERKN_15090 [Velocimicrobium sp.]
MTRPYTMIYCYAYYNGEEPMGAVITAYGSMYNEIVEGYANDTREIWVADGKLGRRKLTKDEELEYLDSVYQKETKWQQMVAKSRETSQLAKKNHLSEAIRKSLGYSEKINSIETPYVKQNLSETVSNVMYEMRNKFLELYQSGEKIDYGNLSNSVLHNYGDFEENIEKIF